MDISRDLAIQILKYQDRNKSFYLPFIVVCKEYSDEDEDFVEIESKEWKFIKTDDKYQTFQLWENLQNLDIVTMKLMLKGFIEHITKKSLENQIEQLAKKYRNQWKEELWESEKIEEYGFNEFIGGKADAFEDCLYLIRKYYNSFN